MKRKDLNKIKVYDDHMAHRYMDDLKRRYPKAFDIVSCTIVAMMFIFSIFGFLQFLIQLRS